MLFGKLFTNPKMWVNGNANEITMGGVYTCKDVQNVPTGDGALFVFKTEDTVKQVFVPVGEEGVVYTRVIGEDWSSVTGTSEETEALIQSAIDKANQAQAKADTVDTRLNNIIVESGTSDAEVVAARTDSNGQTFTTLGVRLDTQFSEVNEDISVGLKALALNNRLLIDKLIFSDGYWGRTGEFIESTATFHTEKMEVVAGHQYYVEFPSTTPTVLMRSFNDDGTVNSTIEKTSSSIFIPTTNIIAFNAIGNAKNDNIYLYDAETTLKSKTDKPHNAKTISIIGDSLSDKANDTALVRYYDIVDQMLGTVSTEYAMSGCGYKRKYNNGDAFYEQANKISSNTDLVLIFGSFNDHNIYDTEGLGNITDKTTDTVFGCVYTTLQTIFTKAPRASVGIILPTPWKQYPPYNTNTLQWDYIEGIKSIASHYSIPVLDLYTESNMRPWDTTFRSHYYADGTHPNSYGHKRFAPKVVEFVKSILEYNS